MAVYASQQQQLVYGGDRVHSVSQFERLMPNKRKHPRKSSTLYRVYAHLKLSFTCPTGRVSAKECNCVVWCRPVVRPSWHAWSCQTAAWLCICQCTFSHTCTQHADLISLIVSLMICVNVPALWHWFW